MDIAIGDSPEGTRGGHPIPPRASPRGRTANRLLVRSAFVAAASLLAGLTPARSYGVDGAVDGRSTVQEGQAGADTYHQTTTNASVNGRQVVPLAGGFQIGADGHYDRERYRSRFGSTRTSFYRRTTQAGIALDQRAKPGNFRLGALTFRQRTYGGAGTIPVIERQQLQANGDYRFARWRFDASGLFISSRRELSPEEIARNDEWSGSFGTRADIRHLGELGYRFSTLSDRNLTLDSRSTWNTHAVTFESAGRFAGGRGQASVKTNSSFFTQTTTRETGGPGARLLVPHAGGFVLDDTPEIQDPLEPEITPDARLYDGDRQTATGVEIGDSAPAVRQFGGDYRNIVFDFGEALDLASAVLYIDRTLVAPELFRWRVYVTNDPDGRRWDEAGGAAVAYQERGVGLQGWSVTFAQPVNARFFKMVDEKLGPTVPQLSVTELEVYTPGEGASQRDRSSTTNHRIGASLGYQLSSHLRAGYDLTYRRRTLGDDAGVLEDRGHGFSGAWNRGIWSVAGRYEFRTLEGRSRATRASTHNLSVTRARSSTFETLLAGTRIHDRSPGVARITYNISLASIWRAAPALRLNQRITSSWQNDFITDETSRSFLVVTSASGEPVSSMSLEFEQSERWVTREGGTGFSRFEDTSLALGWRPVPLIALQSSVRYQVRDRGDWLTRNSINWDLLPEGDFRLGLSAYQLRDTRASQTERGAGTHLEWITGRGLTLEGTVEMVRLKSRAATNSPRNVEFRGIWRY